MRRRYGGERRTPCRGCRDRRCVSSLARNENPLLLKTKPAGTGLSPAGPHEKTEEPAAIISSSEPLSFQRPSFRLPWQYPLSSGPSLVLPSQPPRQPLPPQQ